MISLKSEITKKLLNYFFINPDESLYVNELSRKLELDKRNLVKKIKDLEKEGILNSQERGNLKLYSINKNFALYNEYRNIVLKTVGFEDKLKNLMQDLTGVKKVYIYGSYAKNNMDAHSDIDLLIIGEHNIIKFQRELNKVQKEINREINCVHMSQKDFNRRLKNKDPFITTILKNKYISLM